MEDKKKVKKEVAEETVEQPEILEDAKDKELKEALSKVEEFKDKWMRSVAEFDNYKKRNAKIWQDAFNEGLYSVVLKILPIGDNLDRAILMGLDEKTTQGLISLKNSFNDTLKQIGVEEVDPTGQPFDPNIAEAVIQAEDETLPPDTVKQVFEKGYKLKDKMIRYAKVSVTK